MKRSFFSHSQFNLSKNSYLKFSEKMLWCLRNFIPCLTHDSCLTHFCRCIIPPLFHILSTLEKSLFNTTTLSTRAFFTQYLCITFTFSSVPSAVLFFFFFLFPTLFQRDAKRKLRLLIKVASWKMKKKRGEVKKMCAPPPSLLRLQKMRFFLFPVSFHGWTSRTTLAYTTTKLYFQRNHREIGFIKLNYLSSFDEIF